MDRVWRLLCVVAPPTPGAAWEYIHSAVTRHPVVVVALLEIVRPSAIKYQLLFGFLAGSLPKKSRSTDKKAIRIRIFLKNIGIF